MVTHFIATKVLETISTKNNVMPQKKTKYHFGALTVRDFLAFYKVSFKPHEKASS